jgi:hypothetical protein
MSNPEKIDDPTTSTSSTNAPPKVVPPSPKHAKEMTAAEYAAAKSAYLAANRRKW